MRIGLVGCVKGKRSRPAPARELYTSALFLGRRAFVEATCERWFILSAKHGLVDPDDVLEPYDQTLKDASEAHRRQWSAMGPGHTPEIYPGTEIVEFSPTADFQTTMDVVGKNMEAMGS